MMLQLEPLIEMNTPKGFGYAMFVIDPGMDNDLYWVIAINDTGEIWTFANREVRMAKNITLGRMLETKEEYIVKGDHYRGCL